MTPDEIINRHSKLYELFAGIPIDAAIKITKFFDQEQAIATVKARIQERKDCIYVLEQDLLDNGPEGEGVYSEDYRRCINDEIQNHKAFITDLENELLALK